MIVAVIDRFLEHGTLVGLLPVPHPILIRRYQPNPGTAMWFRYPCLYAGIVYIYYTVKKVIVFPVLSWDVAKQNSPWPGIIKLFPARESLISDIPAG